MNHVSVIGAGRLGTALAHALSKKGYRIRSLSCRTLSSAQESRRIVGDGQPFTDNIQAAQTGQIVIITVPDDLIKNVSEQLATGISDWSRKLVFHCSGLHTSHVLSPLKLQGALTASIHPIQSFAEKSADPHIFADSFFSIEGGKSSLPPCKDLVQKLGGNYFLIKAKDKPLYHAACSIASNYLVVLLDTASVLLQQVGTTEKQSLEILSPLIQGTLQNVKKLNTTSALTGPIERGDISSIEKHLLALQKYPSQAEVYLEFARKALDLVKHKKRFSPKKIKDLETLLAGK